MGAVLIVDDEPKLGRLIAEALEDDGHSCRRAQNGREALIELATRSFDLVITDLRMPEVDGMEVLRTARARPNPPPVVVMTAYGTAESAVAAMKAGAADYLVKPFALDELRMRARRWVEHRSLERTTGALVGQLTPSLVAQSPKMKAVLEAARRAAATDATVLLLGESGTGKSQLARLIHYESARRAGALVEVHCAALPESLLESELFGHVRGAFTGADQTREGHLARADGGTLFIDEVGEISQATQVKLLRFLQEREFVPVGANASRKVNVRVVAATNRDLAAAVRQGSFREDFFYRLNVFALEVPPLRQRSEDLEPLIDGWLSRKGLPREKVSADARARLLSYGWPGNIRELENVLERALILAGPDTVTPAQLALESGGTARKDVSSLLGDGFNLDALERDLITAALERTSGNKAAAARLLGITRRRLYSRLESLGRMEADED